MQKLCYATAFLMFASAPLLALEAQCEPILAASEARIKQPTWHSVTEMGAGTKMKMEIIKSDGKFFSNIGEKWSVMPVSVDDTERELLAQIRAGQIKLTQCKKSGSSVVEGVPVTIISSRLEMPGAPAAEAQLYIGSADGLPYRQTGTSFSVNYHYKGIVAPPL